MIIGTGADDGLTDTSPGSIGVAAHRIVRRVRSHRFEYERAPSRTAGLSCLIGMHSAYVEVQKAKAKPLATRWWGFGWSSRVQQRRTSGTIHRKLRKGEIRKAQTNKRGLFIDLESLREAFDGAPYHRAKAVREAATALNITLMPLPGYSPDLMPVEALWRWLREDVTYHHCHASADDLTRRVADFEVRLNRDPFVIADRLWVKDHLDPEEEKLRFSK